MIPPEDMNTQNVPDNTWSINKEEYDVLLAHNDSIQQLLKQFDTNVVSVMRNSGSSASRRQEK